MMVAIGSQLDFVSLELAKRIGIKLDSYRSPATREYIFNVKLALPQYRMSFGVSENMLEDGVAPILDARCVDRERGEAGEVSRSRYRPPVSHSLVRRLHRHERRERVDAIAADYDARVAAMHGLEWWERQWEARMRGGRRLSVRRQVRRARDFYRSWLRSIRRSSRRFTITWPDLHPGVPCHSSCGCVGTAKG